MKAMILAAGFGTRLRPLTDITPKPLLPIGGKPLIEWNLLLLRRHGITEVIINLHHLGDQIEKALGDGSQLGMSVSYSRERGILGTGGGIKQAAPYFSGEAFVVLNGDTLVDLDFGALVDSHHQHGALATMVLRDDPDVDAWGPVEVDENGQVIRINGKGLAASRSTRKLMFAGVHVMHPRLLRYVSEGAQSSIIDAYLAAISDREVILGYRMEGYWSDVGSLTRYEQAEHDVQSGLLRISGLPPSSHP